MKKLHYFLFLALFIGNANANDVMGIGGPALDIIIPVSESFLSQFQVTKGSVGYIDWQTADQIITKAGPAVHYSVGGLNTIRSLAKLGMSCSGLGVIGDDEAGIVFEKNLLKIPLTSYLRKVDTNTTKIICLITPDADRTMLIVSGAGRHIDISDLKPEYFQDKKLVHIEGVLMIKPDLVERAMQLAKDHKAQVSFQMPKNFSLIEKNKETIVRLLKTYVDVVFGNHEQIKALFGLGIDQGCKKLQTLSNIAVVTSKNGCCVGCSNSVFFASSLPCIVVDTTGAGDSFAAGFLYGYLNNYPLKNCASCGHMVSKIAIEQYGADIPTEILLQLKPLLK